MHVESKFTPDKSVAIIGGSLVGPLTEQLFRSAGFEDIKTYEAESQARFSSGGIIGIAGSAYPALYQAGIPLEEIKASSSDTLASYNLDARGNVTSQGKTTSLKGINTTWDIFHSALLLRTPIIHSKKLSDVFPDSGRVKLSFDDGVDTYADLVIFADGRRSTGRTIFDSNRHLKYQNYVVWRGITEPTSYIPDSLTRYHNKDNGVAIFVSEPIQKGKNAGKIDWTLTQNISPQTLEEMTGKKSNTVSHVFPYQMTPELRSPLEGYAQRQLPDFLSELVINTLDISMVPITMPSRPTQCVWQVGGGYSVLLGDALMPMHPHSRRGLNNGIDHGMNLRDQLVTGGTEALASWGSTTLASLDRWIAVGESRALKAGQNIPH